MSSRDLHAEAEDQDLLDEHDANPERFERWVVVRTLYVVQHKPFGQWRVWASYWRKRNAETEAAKITDRPTRIMEIPVA